MTTFQHFQAFKLSLSIGSEIHHFRLIDNVGDTLVFSVAYLDLTNNGYCYGLVRYRNGRYIPSTSIYSFEDC